MKNLRLLVERNRIFVAAAVTAALLSNLSLMFYTCVLGEFANRIVEKTAVDLAFLALLGVFLISNATTQFLGHYLGRLAAEKMAHSLRMGYATRLIQKATNDREGVSVSSAMSVAQNELAQADAYLGNSFFIIAEMLFTGILTTGFLLFQNVFLTLTLIAPTAIILIYVQFSSRKLAGIVSAAQEEKRRMNQVVYSAVHAFPAVKTFDGEALCKGAFEERLQSWKAHAARNGRWHALYNTLSGILSRVPLLLLFLAGGYLVIRGNIKIGTLIIFLNLQGNLTSSIMNLPAWLSGFRVFTTNLSRVEIE